MFKYEDLYHYYAQFCPIPAEEWQQLEAYLKPVTFPKGDILIKQNVLSPDLFAIRRGIVRTFYTTKEGKETVKIFLTKGQIVSPYIENITGQLPRATSAAVTDVEGISIPFKQLIEILDSSHELTRLHLRLVQSFYATKEKREYEFLTLDATERYQIFLEEFKPYLDQIPNMYVASYIGVTPVSLSRLRKQFKGK